MKYISEAFSAFLKLPFKEKIFLLTVFLILTAISLILLESTMSYFSLSKASNSLDILERVVEIRNNSVLTKKEDIILSQITDGIIKDNERNIFPISGFSVERFFYGIIPWFIFRGFQQLKNKFV